MRKMVIVLILACLVLLLTACQKTLSAGTVIDKHFSPSHITYNPIIMVMNGKTRITPRYIPHSDAWSILVQNGEDKEWWEVSKEYYESVNIGDHVERNVK